MRTRIPIFDHRGGVNSNYSEEMLQPNELRAIINGRLSSTYGAVVKRHGTQRVHDSAISSSTADVLGGIQWDAPSAAAQIVSIAGGNLYHKTLAATDYTEVASTFSTTVRPIFASFVVGGSRVLYIADGGTFKNWTGAAVNNVGGGSQSFAYIKVYKSRMFGAVADSKTLYWCDVADPTDWTGGGSAPVETYDDEPLVGMETVGSSLLLFKEDTIARFQGVSRDNIQIDLNTEGVSADYGCIAKNTICRFGQRVFFLSDRGPCVASESSAEPIGDRILDAFSDISKSNWSTSVAVHDKANREIQLWMPSGSSGNDIGWFWNYDLNAWTGPHNIAGSGYAVYSAWGVENTDGTENVYLGGGDGRVRDTDLATAYDDRTRSDTGGTAITMDVEYPALYAGDLGTVKMLHPTQVIHADLKTTGSLQVITSSDLTASNTITIASAGTGSKQYKVRPACRGRKPKVTLRDATAERIEITGLDLELELGRRVA